MIETVYIVRHASRMSDTSFRFPSPTQTLRDPPLTAHGSQQIVHFAQHMRDKNVQAIFSSPFWRCLQTATPVAEALDLPILVEPGLQEWFGRVKPNSGIHPRPPPAKTLAQYFSRIDATAHRPLLLPPRRGERMMELHQRAKDVLALLFEELERKRPEVKVILLVSHAATLIALGRALLDDDTVEIPAPTCGLSRYDRTGNGGRLGKWSCAYKGNCDFLPGGAERDWAYSHIEEVEETGVCPEEDDDDDAQEAMRSKL